MARCLVVTFSAVGGDSVVTMFEPKRLQLRGDGSFSIAIVLVRRGEDATVRDRAPSEDSELATVGIVEEVSVQDL